MECDFYNKYYERILLYYKVKLFSYFAYARFRSHVNHYTLCFTLPILADFSEKLQC